MFFPKPLHTDGWHCVMLGVFQLITLPSGDCYALTWNRNGTVSLFGKNPIYRIAISKIRTSSHKLEIETGRYTRHITPIEKRICHLCKVVKDEFHFILQCYIYTIERDNLLKKNQAVDPLFQDKLPVDKFAYLVTSNDAQTLTWVGKYVHSSFEKRENYMQPWEMIHSVL